MLKYFIHICIYQSIKSLFQKHDKENLCTKITYKNSQESEHSK